MREVYDKQHRNLLVAVRKLEERKTWTPEELLAIENMREAILLQNSKIRVFLNETKKMQQIKLITKEKIEGDKNTILAKVGEKTVLELLAQHGEEEKFVNMESHRYGHKFDLNEYLDETKELSKNDLDKFISDSSLLLEREDLLPDENFSILNLLETYKNQFSELTVLKAEAINFRQLRKLTEVRIENATPQDIMAKMGEVTVKLINQQSVAEDDFVVKYPDNKVVNIEELIAKHS